VTVVSGASLLIIIRMNSSFPVAGFVGNRKAELNNASEHNNPSAWECIDRLSTNELSCFIPTCSLPLCERRVSNRKIMRNFYRPEGPAARTFVNDVVLLHLCNLCRCRQPLLGQRGPLAHETHCVVESAFLWPLQKRSAPIKSWANEPAAP
jgi:hypothetical protein